MCHSLNRDLVNIEIILRLGMTRLIIGHIYDEATVKLLGQKAVELSKELNNP